MKINYLLQLFFVRITRCERTVIDEINILEVSATGVNSCGIGGIVKKTHKEHWYTIQGFIVPFTGWNGRFSYVGKRWFAKITEDKISK